jgi:hypothetical protein
MSGRKEGRLVRMLLRDGARTQPAAPPPLTIGRAGSARRWTTVTPRRRWRSAPNPPPRTPLLSGVPRNRVLCGRQWCRGPITTVVVPDH